LSAGRVAADAASLEGDRARRDGVRRHLRGSSLLLVGRLASLAINLGVQVLTVRYLVRADYGTFAWALVAIAGATQFVLLGLDTTVSRFVAIYHERADQARVRGAIALSLGGIGVASLLLVGGALAGHSTLPGLLGAEPDAVRLLLVMIAMAPLQALDSILHALYGVFGHAGSIMVRRYLVGPGLKLASVLVVMAMAGGIFELALAYVASLAIGVGVYGVLLVQILRRDRVLVAAPPRPLVLPAREMFGFAASLLTAELVFFFYGTFVTMILQYFHGANEVAGFQAARPFAKLNDVVLATFVHLFVPALARFHARGDREGVEHLHGQTCVWITLLSFPLFALTFGMADTLALRVLGGSYADVGGLLAWMSFGFFVHAALGANSHSLRVLGFVRTAVAADLLAVVVSLAIALALIPALGQVGAAVTLALVLGVRGGIHLAALAWRTRLSPVRGYGTLYAVVAAATLVLWLARPFTAHSLPASAGVSLLAIGVVLGFARRRLALRDTFPEIARLPIVGRLLG
jgi:O-antigen/teichoic acid export membrane protein